MTVSSGGQVLEVMVVVSSAADQWQKEINMEEHQRALAAILTESIDQDQVSGQLIAELGASVMVDWVPPI